MGEHFQTCLALESFNFFSTIANITDANKRVLYARYSKTQKIVGRCLFALTKHGALIHFHVYCHEPKLELKTLITQFSVELAQEMKTMIQDGGKVETLLAHRWYDDGAESAHLHFFDIAGLETKLKTLPLAEVIPAIINEVGVLSESTLPIIFDLDVFESRQNLILPLLSHIEPLLRNIPLPVVKTILELAICAGAERWVKQSCYRLLSHIRSKHRQYLFGHKWRGVSEIALLCSQIAPSISLKLLQKTRWKQKNWMDEENDIRIQACAQAMQSLGRKEQAVKLLKKLREH